MFSSLGSKIGTKIALHKAGLGNVSVPSLPKSDSSSSQAGDGFKNPFANVQLGVPKAFTSWQTPPPPPNPVREPPVLGDRAQSNPKLKFPAIDGRPCVVLFLRYCGCPCKWDWGLVLGYVCKERGLMTGCCSHGEDILEHAVTR
jgi:hypothetical protein